MAIFPYLMGLALAVMSQILPVTPVAATLAAPSDYVFEAAPGCAPTKPAPTAIYNVCADQMDLVRSAWARAERRGRPLLVVFGATWCPSCKTLKAVLPGVLDRDAETAGIEVVEIGISTLAGGRAAPVSSGVTVQKLLLKDSQTFVPRGVPFMAIADPKTGRVFPRNLDDVVLRSGDWNEAGLQKVLAEASRGILGDGAMPGEPSWLALKWRRIWN